MYAVKVNVGDSLIEGKGYFAAKDIPMGTLVYFYGEHDLRVSREQFAKMSSDQQTHLQEFGVEDEYGNWVETSTGPYTNHSCDPNIMQIFVNGIYMDIAVRDIKKDEEITIDYAQFYSSQVWYMECHCHSKHCRKIVGFGVPLTPSIEQEWENKTANALEKMNNVPQSIYSLSDSYALKLTEALKRIKNPTLAKLVKFSIIESAE